MSSRKRRPSGPTQPETRRKARQRLLRLLPPSTGAGPPRRSQGLTASGYVSALVMRGRQRLDDGADGDQTPPTDAD